MAFQDLPSWIRDRFPLDYDPEFVRVRAELETREYARHAARAPPRERRSKGRRPPGRYPQK